MASMRVKVEDLLRVCVCNTGEGLEMGLIAPKERVKSAANAMLVSPVLLNTGGRRCLSGIHVAIS